MLGFMNQNTRMKKEFVFEIEKDEDMLVATCHEPEMATQGENLDELLVMVRDLIRCRFDDGDAHLNWPTRLPFLPFGSSTFSVDKQGLSLLNPKGTESFSPGLADSERPTLGGNGGVYQP